MKLSFSANRACASFSVVVDENNFPSQLLRDYLLQFRAS